MRGVLLPTAAECTINGWSSTLGLASMTMYTFITMMQRRRQGQSIGKRSTYVWAKVRISVGQWYNNVKKCPIISRQYNWTNHQIQEKARYPIISITILQLLKQAHYPIRNTILQSLCKAQFSHKVCMTILQYPWCPFELIILRGELMTNFCLRGRKIVALLILYNSINLA